MNIEDSYNKALNTVADVTGITVEDIKGKCRLRYLVDARCMVIMLLLGKGFTTKEISAQIGVSRRWIQFVIKSFRDRILYSCDDKLRSNWEESAKQLLSNQDTAK